MLYSHLPFHGAAFLPMFGVGMIVSCSRPNPWPCPNLHRASACLAQALWCMKGLDLKKTSPRVRGPGGRSIP